MRLAKGLILAAPHSGSGKTLITMGLIRALKNSGLKVAAAKVGPDYIDAGFHSAASGTPCINLDLWAMGPALCRDLLADQGFRQDIVVIEGVMGLFDGPRGAKGSTADLATELNLPVVLVIDASHHAQSIAAIVHGFKSFRRKLNVAGVVLNRVKSDRHEAMLRDSLKRSKLPILGALRQSDSLDLPSRHLGLVQAQENQQLETHIQSAAARVSRETKLDSFLNLATDVTNQPLSRFMTPLGQHMAIAQDEAFSFIYPHLLKLWRNAGAALSFFSPLANEAPSLQATAVFLPGGYPELHAGRIARNTIFREALQRFKGPIYGECGGYMTLGESLTDASGVSHQMLGLLPVATSFQQRKLHLGYRRLHPLSGPWLHPLRAHEFHYSTVLHEGNAQRLFAAKDASGADLEPMGLRVGQVFGSYAHIIAEAP
jgi:cobyrinic acid a,c-diamide synthase